MLFLLIFVVGCTDAPASSTKGTRVAFGEAQNEEEAKKRAMVSLVMSLRTKVDVTRQSVKRITQDNQLKKTYFDDTRIDAQGKLIGVEFLKVSEPGAPAYRFKAQINLSVAATAYLKQLEIQLLSIKQHYHAGRETDGLARFQQLQNLKPLLERYELDKEITGIILSLLNDELLQSELDNIDDHGISASGADLTMENLRGQIISKMQSFKFDLLSPKLTVTVYANTDKEVRAQARLEMATTLRTQVEATTKLTVMQAQKIEQTFSEDIKITTNTQLIHVSVTTEFDIRTQQYKGVATLNLASAAQYYLKQLQDTADDINAEAAKVADYQRPVATLRAYRRLLPKLQRYQLTAQIANFIVNEQLPNEFSYALKVIQKPVLKAYQIDEYVTEQRADLTNDMAVAAQLLTWNLHLQNDTFVCTVFSEDGSRLESSHELLQNMAGLINAQGNKTQSTAYLVGKAINIDGKNHINYQLLNSRQKTQTITTAKVELIASAWTRPEIYAPGRVLLEVTQSLTDKRKGRDLLLDVGDQTLDSAKNLLGKVISPKREAKWVEQDPCISSTLFNIDELKLHRGVEKVAKVVNTSTLLQIDKFRPLDSDIESMHSEVELFVYVANEQSSLTAKNAEKLRIKYPNYPELLAETTMQAMEKIAAIFQKTAVVSQ